MTDTVPYASLGSDPQQRMRDESHLRTLSICHYVWAGLTAFFSLFPLIHVTIGILAVTGTLKDEGTGQPMPSWFGILFIVMGGTMVLLGETMAVLNFVVARSLRRRKRRVLSLIVAGINCAFMPLGTVLGVFTFIVLLSSSVQAQYQAAEHDARAAF